MVSFLFEIYRRSYLAAAIFYGFVRQIYYKLLYRVAADKPVERIAGHVGIGIEFRFAGRANVTGVFKTAVIEKVGVSVEIQIPVVFERAVVLRDEPVAVLAVQIYLARIEKLSFVCKDLRFLLRDVKQYLAFVVYPAVVDKPVSLSVFGKPDLSAVVYPAVVDDRVTVRHDCYAVSYRERFSLWHGYVCGHIDLNVSAHVEIFFQALIVARLRLCRRSDDLEMRDCLASVFSALTRSHCDGRHADIDVVGIFDCDIVVVLAVIIFFDQVVAVDKTYGRSLRQTVVFKLRFADKRYADIL